MFEDILLAVIQAGTEFLPVSSSGHLVFVSKLISEPNLFFFSVLHAGSLFAALIFTRNEVKHIIKFDEGYEKWWLYIVAGIIPAALVGFLFKSYIEAAFSSYLFIGVAFIFTGCFLYTTKFRKEHTSHMTLKTAIIIGLFQVIALFPGISRSGITITTALLLGIDKEKAIKFSFLMYIPLAFGAVLLNCVMKNGILEGSDMYVSASLITSFIVCLAASLLFLNLLLHIVKRGKFWIFSPYCLAIGIVSIILHFVS